MFRHSLTFFLILFAIWHPASAKIVSFPSGSLTLHGVFYMPEGKGPFPAVLYNHGSAPGMLSNKAFEELGPLFASRGWIFFAPWRRGQGLSADAGPYIGDEIAVASKQGGLPAAAATATKLLKTDHLNDQLAGLAWLQKQQFVKPSHIAVMGNSFGGIETILGAEYGKYCAAIDASGAAESWALAPELQALLIESVQHAQTPIFFFQAANDYDLAPSKTLSEAMKKAGKKFEMKIYPAFGTSAEEGHSFAYMGSATWADDVFGFLKQYCGK